MLCLQLLYLANMLVDVWISFLIVHLGAVLVHTVLLPVCMASWPTFIKFLKQAFKWADQVIEEQQRTVQLRGVPEDMCFEKELDKFIREQEIENVTRLSVNKKKQLWELTFASKQDMKKPFQENEETKNPPKLAKDVVLDNSQKGQ